MTARSDEWAKFEDNRGDRPLQHDDVGDFYADQNDYKNYAPPGPATNGNRPTPDRAPPEEVGKGAITGEPRDRFSMVGESVLLNRRDDGCFVLYCYLDLKQGPGHRPTRGFAEVAGALGSQRDTVATHARHLAADGLIKLEEGPTRNSKAVMLVVHNPARKGQRAEGVRLVPRRPRYRSASVYKTGPAPDELGRTTPQLPPTRPPKFAPYVTRKTGHVLGLGMKKVCQF